MGFVYLILRAGSTIFLSLVLAVLALVYVGIEYPGQLTVMLSYASHTKEWLTDTTNTGLDPRYNVWAAFLINEQQFVFMFFVVVMRIVLLFFFSSLSALYRLVMAAPTQSA